jgi:hypothetical protein
VTAPATLPPAVEVDGPGVYDLPNAVYHADPVPGGSLSSTGARKLLPPEGCPAKFKHWRDAGPERKPEFDFGHGAHRELLGDGEELVIVDAASWRTKAAAEAKEAAYAAGKTPLLRSDHNTILEMVPAFRADPVAGGLFQPGTGRPEQTLIWRDERTGVMCRALLDWLPFPVADRRFILRDYKTGRTAAPDKLGRVIGDYGYHVQLAFYLMGAQALGLAGEDAKALLAVQEKTAPYLVTVVEPDPAAMRMGAIRCRQALEVYAECAASGRWPGYSDDVVLAELPPWETRELNGVAW